MPSPQFAIKPAPIRRQEVRKLNTLINALHRFYSNPLQSFCEIYNVLDRHCERMLEFFR